MNKSYRSVYNEALDAWVATSELTKSQGKRSRSGASVASAVFAAVLGVGGFFPLGAQADFAIGPGASATGGMGAVAFGQNAKAQGQSATAVGGGAGSGTVAGGEGSVAIGSNTSAYGQYSLALGDASSANGNFATAMGQNSHANADRTIALGRNSTANLEGAVALGVGTNASGFYSLALGEDAQANVANSVALGRGSVASNPDNVSSATLRGVTRTFAGASSMGVLSIGTDRNNTRQIQNVSAGEVTNASTDAVNGSQLYAAFDAINDLDLKTQNAPVRYSSAAAPTTPFTADNSIVTNDVTLAGSSGGPVGLHNVANGQVVANSKDGVNGGQLFDVDQRVISNTTAITNISNGGGIKYFHTNSVLPDSAATGPGSIAVGPNALASGEASISMGVNSVASNFNSIAVGNGNVVSGVGSGAFGDPNIIAGNFSYAVGDNNIVPTDETFVFGNNVNTTGSGTGNIVLGTGSTIAAPSGVAYSTATAAPGSQVSIGARGAERRITNLAGGSDATDAVNVAQLNQVAQNTVNALGGGAAYNATNGAYTAPNYSVGGKNYNNVGEALGAENNIVTNLGGTVANTFGGTTTYNATTGAVTGSTFVVNGNTYNNVTNALDAINGAIVGGGIKYFHANSTLPDSSAVGVDSVAIGPNALAANAGDVALGRGSVTSTATGTPGAVIGVNNGKGGTYYAFAGPNATSTVSVGAQGAERTITNVAAGRLSAVSTDAVNGSQLNATNLQVGANTYDITQITTGALGAFRSDNTSNVGNPNASGANATAGGFGASATGSRSTVIGNSATDNNVANSTVLGNGASIVGGIGGSNVALGQSSIVAAAPFGTADVVIGTTKYNFAGTTPVGSVSVGSLGAERAVTNVAAGRLSATSTDAVNGSQLFATNKQVTDNTTNITNLTTNVTNGSIGTVQRSGTPNDLALTAPGGTGTVPGVAQTLSNVAAGSLEATSNQGVNGSQINKLGTSIATNFGGGSKFNTTTGEVTNPTYVVNAGSYNNVGDAFNAIDKSISGGAGIKYFHASSTLADSEATGTDSVAIGPMAKASAMNAVAMGMNAVASKDNSVALGGNSVADRGALAGYTAFGLTAVQNSVGDVSVGSATDLRQLTNVAAGTEVNDAVNVGQLKGAVNGLGNSITNVLGGTYDNSTGAYTGPTYNTYGGSTSKTIQEAFNTYNSALTKVENGGVGPVQYSDAATPAVPNGGQPSNNVTLVGADKTAPVGMHNVAAGATTADSTDAINGGQLNKVSTSVANNFGGGSTYDPVTGTVTAPTYNLQGGSYNNVGSALGALDTATTNNTTAITNITNGTSGIVR